VWVRAIISAVACFLLCVGFLLLSVGFVGFNKSFYASQFAKNETAVKIGISDEDLRKVSNQMIAYLSGHSRTCQVYVTFSGEESPRPFYDEKQLSHMADARKVFIGVQITAHVFFWIGAATLVLLFVFYRKKFLQPFARGAIIGGGLLLLVGAILGIIMAANFGAAFEMLHEIFFPQGNWQFDVSSPLITMLPESLFLTAATYILACGVLFTLLLIFVGVGMLVYLSVSRKAKIFRCCAVKEHGEP